MEITLIKKRALLHVAILYIFLLPGWLETMILPKAHTSELPVLVSFLSINPLLGPNPTGIIGLSGLMVGAIYLFLKLEHRQP